MDDLSVISRAGPKRFTQSLTRWVFVWDVILYDSRQLPCKVRWTCCWLWKCRTSRNLHYTDVVNVFVLLSGIPPWSYYTAYAQNGCVVCSDLYRISWLQKLVALCFRVVRPSVHPSHSRERDISGTPWGNFFKFGTNVHLDSRMNWFWFVKDHRDLTKHIFGHKSRIHTLIMTILHKCLTG